MHARTNTRLTREGWYYLFVLGFVLAGGLLREINLLLVFGGMLLGPLLLSWWMARRSLRHLEIQRQLPPAVGAGDLLVIGLTLTHRGRRATARTVVVEDSIERIAPAALAEPVSASVLFTEIPPGESRRMTYRGRLPRGTYQLGPVRIVTRFPLGLVASVVTVERPELIVVTPRLGRLTSRGPNARQDTWLGSKRAQHRHGSLEADFYGLRDWRPGDSRRWIHWRTSARRGGLMVRQFEQPRQEELVVLVELWKPELPEPRQQENVELALSYAATVLSDACRWGNYRMFLGVAGLESVIKPGVASRAYLEDALGALAAAQSSGSASIRGLVGQATSLLKSGSQVIVIGTRPVEIPTEMRAIVPSKRLSVVNVDADQFTNTFTVSPANEPQASRTTTNGGLPALAAHDES